MRPIARMGHMITFFLRAVGSIPVMLRHYRKELLRVQSDITWGNGSIVVGGGTAVGALLLIVSISGLDGWIFSREQLPNLLTGSVTGITTDPTLIMIMILAVVLVLGMFMDATPIILMVVPAITPLIAVAGIDPLHFGVLFCIMCVIGLITPPVGVALYGVSMVSKLPLERVFWASLPFFAMLLLSIAVMVFVPTIITFLPSLMFGD